MLKQDRVKKLYFDYEYKQIEIAKELNVSSKYVSKILIQDTRYEAEKEKRKQNSKIKHNQKTKEYITNKRKQRSIDIEYALLRQAHEQASRELSGGRKPINNRVYRDWNSSIYRYDEKTKSYVLKKEIKVGADVPTKIKWKNF